jgi:hypothetical protein
MIGLFRWLLYASAPVALAKAAISAIHLVTAARNMALIDVNDREEAAKKAKIN